MRNTILAKRYAKALFAVGKEENAFDAYGKVLNEISEVIVSVPEVEDALANPMYPVEVRAKVMEHLISQIQAPPQVMVNFLNLLVQKKRAGVLPDIAEVFRMMVDVEMNVCQGSVVTATELSGDLQEKLQATLEKITGKKVVLSTEVDPAIIGGMIAKVGDLVLDGSLITQLKGLKESIKGSE